MYTYMPVNTSTYTYELLLLYSQHITIFAGWLIFVYLIDFKHNIDLITIGMCVLEDNITFLSV